MRKKKKERLYLSIGETRSYIPCPNKMWVRARFQSTTCSHGFEKNTHALKHFFQCYLCTYKPSSPISLPPKQILPSMLTLSLSIRRTHFYVWVRSHYDLILIMSLTYQCQYLFTGRQVVLHYHQTQVHKIYVHRHLFMVFNAQLITYIDYDKHIHVDATFHTKALTQKVYKHQTHWYIPTPSLTSNSCTNTQQEQYKGCFLF